MPLLLHPVSAIRSVVIFLFFCHAHVSGCLVCDAMSRRCVTAVAELMDTCTQVCACCGTANRLHTCDAVVTAASRLCCAVPLPCRHDMEDCIKSASACLLWHCKCDPVVTLPPCHVAVLLSAGTRWRTALSTPTRSASLQHKQQQRVSNWSVLLQRRQQGREQPLSIAAVSC